MLQQPVNSCSQPLAIAATHQKAKLTGTWAAIRLAVAWMLEPAAAAEALQKIRSEHSNSKIRSKHSNSKPVRKEFTLKLEKDFLWPISEIIPKAYIQSPSNKYRTSFTIDMNQHHLHMQRMLLYIIFGLSWLLVDIRIFHLIRIALFRSTHCYLNQHSFDRWSSQNDAQQYPIDAVQCNMLNNVGTIKLHINTIKVKCKNKVLLKSTCELKLHPKFDVISWTNRLQVTLQHWNVFTLWV